MAAEVMQPQNKENKSNTIARLNPFNGKTTLVVTYPGAGSRDFYFNAGGFKWKQLFMTDPAGDSILLEVVKYLKSQSPEKFDEIRAGVDTFISQLNDWLKKEEK